MLGLLYSHLFTTHSHLYNISNKLENLYFLYCLTETLIAAIFMAVCTFRLCLSDDDDYDYDDYDMMTSASV